MARYRRKRRSAPYRRRRNYRRRYVRRRRKGALRISRSSGFPTSVMAKIRYVTSSFVQLTTASPIGAVAYFGNNPYDPRVALGGHQPYYFDQLMTLYNRYCVYGSKIRVFFNTDDDKNYECVLRPTTEATLVGNMSLEMERPSAAIAVGTEQVTKQLKMYRKTKHVFGQRDLDLDQFSGDASGGPTKLWYWQLGMQPSYRPTTLYDVTVQYTIVITYYTKFYERKTQAQS